MRCSRAPTSGLSAEEGRGLGARGQYPPRSQRARWHGGTVTPRPGAGAVSRLLASPCTPALESQGHRATVPRVFTPAPGNAPAPPTLREENPPTSATGRAQPGCKAAGRPPAEASAGAGQSWETPLPGSLSEFFPQSRKFFRNFLRTFLVVVLSRG